jgi:transcriptional regulator with XRE-family HTH domain
MNRASIEQRVEEDVLIATPILKSAHRAPGGTALFPLIPIGSGTAYVESLSGYIARLSQEHCLLISDFLDVPCVANTRVKAVDRRTRRRLFHASSYQIDGSSVHSSLWVGSLEAATGLSNLRHHTILPFLDLSSDSWLRAWKAWCPHCYQDWLQSGSTLYDPLLWSIKAVTACPIHQCAMVEKCAFCHKRQRPLTNAYIVGRCVYCQTSLSASDSVLHISLTTHDCEEAELWSANEIGRLLAAVPALSSALDLEPVRSVLQSLNHLDPDSTSDTLASCLGITRRSLTTWMSGEVRPRLGGLCRLSFRLQVSLLDLMTGKIPASHLALKLECLRQSIAEVRNTATEAPASVEAPSFVTQVAEEPIDATEAAPKPGESLRRAGQRCRNRRPWRRACCRAFGKKRALCSAQALRSIQYQLEMTLSESAPRSVKQISTGLGVREEFVSRHFPQLKKEMRARYVSWIASERAHEQERIETTVRGAVIELKELNQYPSVGRIVARSPSLRSAGWDRLQRAIRKACKELT